MEEFGDGADSLGSHSYWAIIMDDGLRGLQRSTFDRRYSLPGRRLLIAAGFMAAVIFSGCCSLWERDPKPKPYKVPPGENPEYYQRRHQMELEQYHQRQHFPRDQFTDSASHHHRSAYIDHRPTNAEVSKKRQQNTTLLDDWARQANSRR